MFCAAPSSTLTQSRSQARCFPGSRFKSRSRKYRQKTLPTARTGTARRKPTGPKKKLPASRARNTGKARSPKGLLSRTGCKTKPSSACTASHAPKAIARSGHWRCARSMVTPTRVRGIRDPILGIKLQNPPIKAKSGHQGTCAIANPVAYRTVSMLAMISCERIKTLRTRTDCRKGLPDGAITTPPIVFL